MQSEMKADATMGPSKDITPTQPFLERANKWKSGPPNNAQNPSQQKPKVINFVPSISYQPVQLIPDSLRSNSPPDFSSKKKVGPTIRYVAKFSNTEGFQAHSTLQMPSKSSITLVPLLETEAS